MQKGGRGMKGGAKVAIEGHRHSGIFIARGKEDALVRVHCVCCLSTKVWGPTSAPHNQSFLASIIICACMPLLPVNCVWSWWTANTQSV